MSRKWVVFLALVLQAACRHHAMSVFADTASDTPVISKPYSHLYFVRVKMFHSDEQTYLQSGTIISNRWVITSPIGHGNWTVVKGEITTGLTGAKSERRTYTSRENYLHPQYLGEDPYYQNYKVGLLKTTQAMRFDRSCQPVRLPPWGHVPLENDTATVLGYDKEHVVEVQFTVMSSERCRQVQHYLALPGYCYSGSARPPHTALRVRSSEQSDVGAPVLDSAGRLQGVVDAFEVAFSSGVAMAVGDWPIFDFIANTTGNFTDTPVISKPYSHLYFVRVIMFHSDEQTYSQSGTIISNRWVITSSIGHGNWTVVKGEITTGLTGAKSERRMYTSRENYLHPQYFGEDPFYQNYRVGLLKTTEAMRFDRSCQPVRLPPWGHVPLENDTATVLGYDKEHVVEVQFTVISFARCRQLQRYLAWPGYCYSGSARPPRTSDVGAPALDSAGRLQGVVDARGGVAMAVGDWPIFDFIANTTRNFSESSLLEGSVKTNPSVVNVVVRYVNEETHEFTASVISDRWLLTAAEADPLRNGSFERAHFVCGGGGGGGGAAPTYGVARSVLHRVSAERSLAMLRSVRRIALDAGCRSVALAPPGPAPRPPERLTVLTVDRGAPNAAAGGNTTVKEAMVDVASPGACKASHRVIHSPSFCYRCSDTCPDSEEGAPLLDEEHRLVAVAIHVDNTKHTSVAVSVRDGEIYKIIKRVIERNESIIQEIETFNVHRTTSTTVKPTPSILPDPADALVRSSGNCETVINTRGVIIADNAILITANDLPDQARVRGNCSLSAEVGFGDAAAAYRASTWVRHPVYAAAPAASPPPGYNLALVVLEEKMRLGPGVQVARVVEPLRAFDADNLTVRYHVITNNGLPVERLQQLRSRPARDACPGSRYYNWPTYCLPTSDDDLLAVEGTAVMQGRWMHGVAGRGRRLQGGAREIISAMHLMAFFSKYLDKIPNEKPTAMPIKNNYAPVVKLTIYYENGKKRTALGVIIHSRFVLARAELLVPKGRSPFLSAWVYTGVGGGGGGGGGGRYRGVVARAHPLYVSDGYQAYDVGTLLTATPMQFGADVAPAPLAPLDAFAEGAPAAAYVLSPGKNIKMGMLNVTLEDERSCRPDASMPAVCLLVSGDIPQVNRGGPVLSARGELLAVGLQRVARGTHAYAVSVPHLAGFLAIVMCDMERFDSGEITTREIPHLDE